MKSIFLLIASFSIFVLCSCSKEKATTITASEDIIVEHEIETPAKARRTIDSVMLYEGWTLYSENDVGKMIAQEETQKGDVVKVYFEDDVIEAKKAIRRLQSGQEEELDFVHINVDGDDYWTRDIFVSDAHSLPAVVMNEAYIYSSPKDLSMTKDKLAQGDVVAAVGVSGNFYEVIIYNGTPFGKHVYVDKNDLSDNRVDIEINATQKKIADNTKPEIVEELQDIIRFLNANR